MRKLAKDEIDLSKISTILFSNKLKIFLITFITVIIAFSLKLTQPSSKAFLIKAQIHPITIFEMSKYQEYNAYLSNLSRREINRARDIVFEKRAQVESYELGLFNKSVSHNIKNNLETIDSIFLFSLFISIINEEERIIKLIKKFDIIKKEKYLDIELYEKAVKNLSSSIKVTDYGFLKDKNLSSLSINFSNIYLKFENKEVGMKLLNLIMESINKDIKNHLINEFDNLLISSYKMKVYNIEDIKFEISNNLENKNIVNKLKKRINRIEQNKDIERLKFIFQKTPIFSDEFYAAKLRTPSYEVLGQKDNFKLNFFKFVILGLLFSIIYIMAEKIIKKPKKKLKFHK